MNTVVALTFVKEKDNFVKDFHEVHVIIAVFLHFDKQCELWRSLLTER